MDTTFATSNASAAFTSKDPQPHILMPDLACFLQRRCQAIRNTMRQSRPSSGLDVNSFQVIFFRNVEVVPSPHNSGARRRGIQRFPVQRRGVSCRNALWHRCSRPPSLHSTSHGSLESCWTGASHPQPCFLRFRFFLFVYDFPSYAQVYSVIYDSDCRWGCGSVCENT